tara:strand:+ start:3223 stop:3660 length:438 start_codon:yes stop_codon:yes gene_type:complete
MKVKIKKLHSDAVIPKYAKPGDAGMDLYTIKDGYADKHGNMVYHTGLAMEIPKDHVGLLFPRSSVSKTPHSLRNSVGVIDSGYRGEIIMKFGWMESSNIEPLNLYEKGDRIGQIIIMPHPHIDFVEVDDLSSSDRGSGGFGSTGQ